VLRRARLAFSAILPVSLFFLAWDAFAIKQKHWSFDPQLTLGIYGPFDVPLEEYLFFFIIPLAALLTLEGVKVVIKRFSK
jgi:lycopene cyclase domain-containing protein